jgi:histone-lysine N-methyltransferase SETD3
MRSGGAKFDKMKLRYYSENFRGVHASRDIINGETILFVPHDQLMTLEMAMTSPIGSLMASKNLRSKLKSPKHSFLCCLLMEQRRLINSKFKHYLEILPKSYTNFPIFFSIDEKQLLKGSPFLQQISDKIRDI